ncbi:unnamed protein product [Phytophthora fragariaefolia]|uniref:Unnamed protein product n=1 Tax=Phytophthora fragariaefolia TaxID=1490495 RepID=A0A9W6X4M1_9STRA|nr:unnamed protein product [Phytophthora fragariaefolia]
MVSETQPPTNVGLFAVAEEPALPAASEPPGKKRKSGSGRKKDAVWDLTTVYQDKRVVCNRCGALIHRYGVAKVERVRKHFERKCPGLRDLDAVARGDEVGGAVTSEAVGAAESADAALLGSVTAHMTGGYANKSGTFKRKFAYWLYATGQPFDIVENELLLSALRVLRGNVTLPSKHELENELLDLEFTTSKSKVTKAIGGKRCCLTVEDWVDAGGCSVTTYGVICEGLPYFLEAKTAEFSGELTVGEVEEVMAKEKKAEFYGIVTPTMATLSKYTREKVMKKHPRCTFFYGCVCNALSLLLKDVTSVLSWLEKVQSFVTELADVFRGNHKLQVNMSSPDKNTAAEFPDSSSVCAVLEDVLKHEKELYMVVARRDFVDTTTTPAEQDKLKRLQDFVLGESFVQDVINSLAVLRPLQQQLKHFQEDRPPLSQVFPYVVELLTVYSSMEWLSKKEKALITSCVTERFNAIYGNAHGVAYMLDPLYLGEALDERKRQEVESFIVQFSEHEGHSVDILAQLGLFKAMVAELKQGNSPYWQLLQSGAVPPHDFWVERRGQYPQLQQLALAVFALPAASTSPSPSLAVQGLEVSSRLSTKLKPEQLQRITHIYCNSRREDVDSLPATPQLIGVGLAVVERWKAEQHERVADTLDSVCGAFKQELELAAQPPTPLTAGQVDYDTYNDCCQSLVQYIAANMDTSPYFTQQMDRIILACHSNTSEQVLGSLVTKDIWLRPREKVPGDAERTRTVESREDRGAVRTGQHNSVLSRAQVATNRASDTVVKTEGKPTKLAVDSRERIERKRPSGVMDIMTTVPLAKKKRQGDAHDVIEILSTADEDGDEASDGEGQFGTETETEEDKEEEKMNNMEIEFIDDDDDEDWTSASCENDDDDVGMDELDSQAAATRSSVVDIVGTLCHSEIRSPRQSEVFKERLYKGIRFLDALLCRPSPGKVCSQKCQALRKQWCQNIGPCQNELCKRWHEVEAHVLCCRYRRCEYSIQVMLRETMHQIEHQHERITNVRNELNERKKELVEAKASRQPPSTTSLLKKQVELLDRELYSEQVQLEFYQCTKRANSKAAKEAGIDTVGGLVDFKSHYVMGNKAKAMNTVHGTRIEEGNVMQFCSGTRPTEKDELLPSYDDTIGRLCFAGQRSQEETNIFKECLRKSIKFIDASLCKPPPGYVYNCCNPQCEFNMRIFLREVMHGIEQKQRVVQEERNRVRRKTSALKAIQTDEKATNHEVGCYSMADPWLKDRILESRLLQDEIEQLKTDLGKEEQALDGLLVKRAELKDKLYAIGIDESDDVIDGFPDLTTHYEHKRSLRKQRVY